MPRPPRYAYGTNGTVTTPDGRVIPRPARPTGPRVRPTGMPSGPPIRVYPPLSGGSIVNASPPGPPQNIVPSGYPDPTFDDSLGGSSLADRPPFGLLNPPGQQPPSGPPQLGGGGAQPPNPPPGPPQPPPSGGYGGGDFWDASNPFGYAGGVQYNPLAGGPGGSVPPGPPQPPSGFASGLGQAATTLGSAMLGAAGPQMRVAGTDRTLKPGLKNWMA